MVSLSVAIRMVVSLAVVLCLLFVVARFARRGRPRAGGPEMAVISRVTVGSKASVAVVRLGDRALVVGVTDSTVTLLSEACLEDLVERVDEPETQAVTQLTGEVAVRRVAVATGDPATGERPTGERTQAKPGKLSGSALSPETWRRTVESVRDLTVRR
jgi:flagellar protein FliO/FliZ